MKLFDKFKKEETHKYYETFVKFKSGGNESFSSKDDSEESWESINKLINDYYKLKNDKLIFNYKNGKVVFDKNDISRINLTLKED